MDRRHSILGEVILTYGLILVQLWYVGKVLSPFTLLPLSIVVVSWVLRKDSLQTTGLSHFDVKGSKLLWRFLIVLVVLLFIAGAYFRFLQSQSAQSVFYQVVNLLPGIGLRFIAYIIPAFCQQVVLNSYFVNRIQSLSRNSEITAIITGILFSLVHLPNPVLSVLTFIWGTVSAAFFLKQKNIYPLILVHAILTAFAYCLLPQWLHHEFRVGMQFYLYSPSPCDECIPKFFRYLAH